eukprot:CAMPEP_0172588038 /NCGR_PEP_ID=MMETSP1068-20121228/6995_1 /TAXON_ID=35684 /ORGANISM="Pseudopedinella elastica, Strain CCMP716" /LENGTH=73 /DNA_ID=CAMNT_0013383249 /DNA_START=828 /DNA_END=1049 /DNA_ORIENTATION=+
MGVPGSDRGHQKAGGCALLGLLGGLNRGPIEVKAEEQGEPPGLAEYTSVETIEPRIALKAETRARREAECRRS